MAIPYPFNRLGINSGGTVTPLDPIEGSQGVFIYNSYGSIVSSAMQMVNKDLVNESARVWNKGLFVSPKINRYQSAVIYSGGTALDVSLINSAYLFVEGGYVNGVIVPTMSGGGTPYSITLDVDSGGVVSNVDLHG